MVFKPLPIAFILVLTLAAVGCTKPQEPTVVHEPEFLVQPVTADEPTAADKAELERIQTLNLERLLQKDKSRAYEVMAQLQPSVLNPRIIQSAVLRRHPSTRKALQTFNHALLLAYQQNPQKVKDLGVLDEYKNMFLQGCHDDLTDCENLGYFGQDSASPGTQDPATSKVLQVIASQTKEDSPHYYALVLLAFDVKAKASDPQLNEMLVGRVSQILKSSNASPLEKKVRSALADAICTGQFSDAKLAEALIKLKPWNFSRRRDQGSLDNSYSLFSCGVQLSLFELQTKKIRPQTISAMQEEIRNKNNNLLQYQNEIFGKREAVAKALSLKKIQFRTEILFLLDQVYNGDWSSSDALLFWQALVPNPTEQQVQELVEHVKSYVQLRLLQTTDSANQVMRVYYEDPNLVSEKMIDDTLNKSHAITQMWATTRENANRVQAFTKSAFLGVSAQASEEVESFIQSIPRNILFLATYPHMLAVAYKMSKLEFHKEFRIFWSRIDIKSEFVVQKMMSGELQPWFQFSPDQTMLGTLDLIKAFQFALATDTFKTLNIDPVDFLNVIFDKHLFPKVSNIQTLQNAYNFAYQTPDWLELVHTCNDLENGRHTYSSDIPLKQLEFSAFLGKRLRPLETSLADKGGTGGEVGSVSRHATNIGFYLFTNLYNEEMENIRINIRPATLIYDEMVAALKAHMQLLKVTEERVADQMQSVQKRLDQYKTIQDTYLQSIVMRNREFTHCYFTLIEKELSSQMRVLKYEAEHLRQIHRDMVKARQNPAMISALNAQYRFKGLPKDFAGFNSFDGESYRSYTLDFWLRVKSYYDHGLKTETQNLPSLDTNVTVSVDRSFLELEQYRLPKQKTVLFHPDEDTFVKKGLMLITTPGENYTLWFSPSYLTSSGNWKEHFEGLVLLYRLGHKEVLSDIMSMPHRLIRLRSFNAKTEKILPALGVTMRSDIEWAGGLAGLLVSYQKDPLSLYEYVYSRIIRNHLGQHGYVPEGPFAQEDAPRPAPPADYINVGKQLQNYYNWRTLPKRLIFNLQNNREPVLDSYYRSLWKTELSNLANLEEAIRLRERTDIETDNRPTMHFQIDRKWENPVYLDPRVRKRVEGEVSGIRRNIGTFFD